MTPDESIHRANIDRALNRLTAYVQRQEDAAERTRQWRLAIRRCDAVLCVLLGFAAGFAVATMMAFKWCAP